MFLKGCRNTWASTSKNIKLDTDLIPFIRINSKWVTDIKHKTIKLLEDNIGEVVDDLGYSNDFSNQNKYHAYKHSQVGVFEEGSSVCPDLGCPFQPSFQSMAELSSTAGSEALSFPLWHTPM